MSSSSRNKSTEYVKVASIEELKEGQLKHVEVAGQPVVLANVGGHYFALGGICRHAEWDLADGTLEGYRIICLGHGAEWDLKTGECVKFDEALEPEPVFGVKVEGDQILVTTQPILH